MSERDVWRGPRLCAAPELVKRAAEMLEVPGELCLPALERLEEDERVRQESVGECARKAGQAVRDSVVTDYQGSGYATTERVRDLGAGTQPGHSSNAAYQRFTWRLFITARSVWPTGCAVWQPRRLRLGDRARCPGRSRSTFRLSSRRR